MEPSEPGMKIKVRSLLWSVISHVSLIQHVTNVCKVTATTELFPRGYTGISTLFFLRFLFFIAKIDIQRRGEPERKFFHLLVHSPTGHNGQN